MSDIRLAPEIADPLKNSVFVQDEICVSRGRLQDAPTGSSTAVVIGPGADHLPSRSRRRQQASRRVLAADYTPVAGGEAPPAVGRRAHRALAQELADQARRQISARPCTLPNDSQRNSKRCALCTKRSRIVAQRRIVALDVLVLPRRSRLDNGRGGPGPGDLLPDGRTVAPRGELPATVHGSQPRGGGSAAYESISRSDAKTA